LDKYYYTTTPHLLVLVWYWYFQRIAIIKPVTYNHYVMNKIL